MKTHFSRFTFRFWLLALIWTGSLTTGLAQYAATRLYTVEDGLPMTETTLVHVDSRGYLWVGTSQRGIVRFDGRTFKPYPNSIEMASQAVEDREGNLWFCGANQLGFLRIEPDGRVVRMPRMKAHPRRLTNTVLSDSLPLGRLQISRKTGALLLSSDNFVFQYDPRRESFLFRDSFQVFGGVTAVSPDLSYGLDTFLCSGLVKGKQRQTFLYEGGTVRPIPYPSGPAGRLQGLVQYDSNDGWLFTHPKRVAVMPRGKKIWSSFSGELDEKLGEEGVQLHLRGFQREAYLVFLLRNGEEYWIYDFSAASGSPRVTRFHFKGNVLNFTRDHAGNYWAASHSGLLWISGAFTNFFSDENGRMPADMHALAEDARGRMWFGSYGHGFAVLDGERLTVPPGGDWPDDLQVLPGSLRDDRGHLLFFLQGPLQEQRGLMEVDPRGNRRIHLPMQAGYFVSRDREGRVLLGTQRNGLFIQREPGGCYADACWMKIGLEKGFGLGNVLCATEDRYGRYWMGRPSTGMAVYLPELDTVYNFLREENGAPGLWSLAEDTKGNLWMGTTRGLRHFRPPQTISPDYPLSDHLTSVGESILGDRDIRGLAVYQDSLLAILTDRSFALLHLPSYYADPSRPTIYHFDKRNGYFGGAGEQNALWIDQADKIWFANDRGVTRFDPARWDLESERPAVRIDRLHSYGDQFMPEEEQVKGLQTKHTNISFFFSTTGRPHLQEDIFYYYQLNDDSLRTSQTGEVTYASLAPGRYTFTVFGERHGQRSEAATLQFYIPPIWYRNPLAYLFFFLFATGLVWVAFKVKQRQERELLTARLHVIVNQLNPHFINNSLNWVGVRAADREDEAAAAVIEKLAENIRVIFQNSRRRQSMHSLREELKLVENYFHIQQARFGDRIAYIPPDRAMLERWGGKIYLPLMMIQIHAENALEHGLNNRKAGGWVKVEIEESTDFLRVIVEDNGIGRTAARHIRSLGTQQGVKMLNELIDILNRKNRLKISQRYEDDIFTGADGRHFGTRVVLKLPKQYKYDLSD